MNKNIANKLDDLTEIFCETFGYPRNEFPSFSQRGEDISIDGVITALDSIFFSFVDLEITGYAKEFHVNRVCHAIEEGTFSYPITRRTRLLYRQYKKRRWSEESKLYGLRLRWQIRLNRLIPGASVRIPAIDEIISHKILRCLSVMNCMYTRAIHLYRYKTLEDFYFMDRRFGVPIIVKGGEFDLAKLLFLKGHVKSTAILEVSSGQMNDANGLGLNM